MRTTVRIVTIVLFLGGAALLAATWIIPSDYPIQPPRSDRHSVVLQDWVALWERVPFTDQPRFVRLEDAFKTEDWTSFASALAEAAADPAFPVEAVFPGLEICFKTNRLIRAREAADRLRERDLQSPDVLFTLALTYCRLKSPEAAEPIIRRVLALDPSRERVVQVGRRLNEIGQPKLAIECMEGARDRFPGDVEVLAVLTDAYYTSDRNEDALKTLTELEALEPEKAHWPKVRGDVLWESGRRGEAVEAWKKSLALDPSQKELSDKLNDAVAKMAAGPEGPGRQSPLETDPAFGAKPQVPSARDFLPGAGQGPRTGSEIIQDLASGSEPVPALPGPSVADPSSKAPSAPEMPDSGGVSDPSPGKP